MSLQQSPRCHRKPCWCGICHCFQCEAHRAMYALASLLGAPGLSPRMSIQQWENTIDRKDTGLYPPHQVNK